MAFVHDDPHSQLNDLRTLVTVAVTLLSPCRSSVCLLLLLLLSPCSCSSVCLLLVLLLVLLLSPCSCSSVCLLLLSPCSCSSVCRLVAACGEQQPCPGCRAQSNL